MEQRKALASPSPGRSDDDEAGRTPWLGVLNRRGFRLVMVADVVALSVVLLVSMFWRFGTEWPDAPVANYLLSFALAVAIFVLALYFGGLYEREPRLGAPPVLPRAAQHALGAGGLVALLSLGLSAVARELGVGPPRALPFPITNLAILIGVGALAVAGNRRLVGMLRTRREGPPKVLLVGSPQEITTARRHLEDTRVPAIVVGEVEHPGGLLGQVARTGATDVLLLSSQWLEDLYGRGVRQLVGSGVSVLLRVSARETLYGLERLREVGGMPFVLLRPQTIPRSRARFKRMFDLVVLTIGLPLWLPVLAATGAYQYIVAGPPLLYRQERVGQGGRVFSMLKFRTMIPDAEQDGLGARLAEKRDPRVLRGCRWVRQARLDELPQLWNVVRGEMSLVGPRPERPELTAEFERSIPGYERRHETPPGLTGLAQIHGRYHTDAEYKLGYDLQYLVNWSPVLDLEILLRTIWVVLTGRA